MQGPTVSYQRMHAVPAGGDHSRSASFRRVIRSIAPGMALSLVAWLIVALGWQLPLGWVPVLAAIFVVPGIGLARLLLKTGSTTHAVLVGLPLACGLQFPLLAVAASAHWTPATWGLVAIGIGSVPFVLGHLQSTEAPTGGSLGRAGIMLLAGLALAGSLSVAVSGRDSDDWAYAATVADYAANTRLADSDPALGSDVPMIPRDRYNLWSASLGVAMRATASDAPSLLQDQLPPVIALLAIAAAYLLGSIVGGAAVWGFVAVFTELAWFAVTTAWPEAGDAFLTRGDQDKVAAWLILQPLVFAGVLQLEAFPRWKLLAAGVLAGIGVSAIHPITHLLVLAALVVWVGLGRYLGDRSTTQRVPFVIGFGTGLVTTLLVVLDFQNLGPPAGSELAAFLQAESLRVTAAQHVFSERFPHVIINPALVGDGLTLVTSGLAIVAVAIRRSPGSLLVGSLVLTTVLLAFNPLVTPLIAGALGDYLGLGLLLRIPWLLPVPFAIPALARAWEGRLGARLPLLPIAMIAIVVAIQVPQLRTAYHDWRDRRAQNWRDIPTATDIYARIASTSTLDDVVLAPKRLEFRIPAHDSKVRMVAYRGAIGTIPHFPQERMQEANARVDAVARFYAPHVGFTEDDLATITEFNVRFVVLDGADPRVGEAGSMRWLTELARTPEYALFAVIALPSIPAAQASP